MALDLEICKTCPIYGDHEPWEPDYVDDARFMVVVEPICEAGRKNDRAMPPATKKMFLKHMEKEGFKDEDFNYHPVCLCPYDPNEYANKEKKVIHKHCRQHMVKALEKYKPDAIISLGADATSQVMGRAVKITKVRGLGQHTDEFPQTVLPMLHPGQAVRYPENEPFLASDAAALGRLVDADFDTIKAGDVKAGEFKVVTDLQFLVDMKPELLAFDTETTGLDWFRGGVDVRSYKRILHEGKSFFKPKFQILCMSFTVDENTSYILPWDMPGYAMPEKDRPRIRNQLRKLLCREDKILITGHNVKFDNVALWMTEGIRYRIGGDTLMLAAIYDENAMNKDLASMVKIHCPEIASYSDWFDAKYNKERMWEVPWKDMVPYVGGDTIAAYKLYLELERKVMEDEGDWNHYCRVSIPGLNAFAGIETRGMNVDEENALPEFQEFLTERVEEQRRSLLAQIPREIKRKHIADPRFKGDAVKALSLTRQDLLRDILFLDPKGFRLKPVVWTKTTANLPEKMRVASTSSKDHLPYFFEDCPFTLELAEYVKNERLLSTNIIGFRNKYIVGGKVRPNYSLSKTVTRRSSSMNPNGQNCFPGEVEVLTRAGWRRFDSIGADEDVQAAQYDKLDGSITFARPDAVIQTEYTGDLVHFHTDLFIDILATPNHRMHSRNRKTKQWDTHEIAHLSTDRQLPCAGHYTEGTEAMSWAQVALICAYQADGSTTPNGGIDWGFIKQRKIQRIQEALRAECVPYRVTHMEKAGKPFARVYVRPTDIPEWLRGKKTFGAWLLDWTSRSLQMFCAELMEWDGDSTRGHTYASAQRQNIDWAQIAQTLTGSRSWYRQLTDTCKVLNVSSGVDFHLTTNAKKENVPFSGTVYCFTMPNDSLVVRYNGRVAITGNSPKRGEMAKKYQRMFIAPPGYYLLNCDYSQAELRIAGDMAGDPTIINIYKTGGDIHVATACIALGVTEKQFRQFTKDKQKEWRTKAKAINFGFLYGMGWRKFVSYAKTQYGVEFTEREAKRIRMLFFKKYNRLTTWHERMRALAKKHKYVRSYSGLRRHLPMIDSPEEGIQAEAGRQAINSPVQEFGSTLGVMALGRINDEIDSRYLQTIGFVHDSLVALVKCEYLDWGLKTLKGYMQSNPIQKWFGREMKVPIIADAAFGENLGEVYELPDFDLKRAYDFANSEHLKDKEGNLLIQVPPQKVPPNRGRLQRSPYTLDTDLEPEDIAVREVRHRRVRASSVVTPTPHKRILRPGVLQKIRRAPRVSGIAKPQ